MTHAIRQSRPRRPWSALPVLALSLVLFLVLSVAATPARAEKQRFSNARVLELCAAINGQVRESLPMRMNNLIQEGGITKEAWNNHYAFKVYCIGQTPLEYVVDRLEYEDFKVLADFGIDLNHPITDDEGNISTPWDYAFHKFKTIDGKERLKWKYIAQYLKKKKAKGCADMPKLPCGMPADADEKHNGENKRVAREIYYRYYGHKPALD